ncbi:MAG: NTP transferase domain-containing protein, partial [Alphaproteobacteria bacterium]|nr:NTP transferase domain-containing protein [Alphaproteobacteria bacterium]
MPLATLILAAGMGKRMNSDLPKVLHPLAGAPLLAHAMRASVAAGAEKIVVVAGHGAELVAAAAKSLDPMAEIIVQKEQLGTGDAVKSARDALADFDGDVIVLYGDTPFVRAETLADMLAARSDGHAVVVLGFEAENPGGYGRLVVGVDGTLSAIVEAKEATPDELALTLCNSGVICADAGHLFDLVDKIGNDNTAGEYYLTDIVA